MRIFTCGLWTAYHKACVAESLSAATTIQMPRQTLKLQTIYDSCNQANQQLFFAELSYENSLHLVSKACLQVSLLSQKSNKASSLGISLLLFR